VIDTVGIKIGRYSMLDSFGTPYTERLAGHVRLGSAVRGNRVFAHFLREESWRQNVAQGLF
jgi:hypothetical protein